jgi:hypothetical protein
VARSGCTNARFTSTKLVGFCNLDIRWLLVASPFLQGASPPGLPASRCSVLQSPLVCRWRCRSKQTRMFLTVHLKKQVIRSGEPYKAMATARSGPKPGKSSMSAGSSRRSKAGRTFCGRWCSFVKLCVSSYRSGRSLIAVS